MKKLFLLAALILIAGLCFAQDEEAGTPAREKKPREVELLDVEVSAGFPVHWTNSPIDHKFFQDAEIDTDRTVTSNTAIGLALLFNFNKKFGLTLDTDFFYGADVMGHTGTDSYSTSLFGANVLLGPVFFLYNGNFLRIPLAIGAHMSYWSSDHWDYTGTTPGGITGADTWIKIRDLQLGPGAYLGIQFHFNDSIYIFSRTNVAIDLFRWHQIWHYDGATEVKETHTELAIAWTIKPSIGLGIKF
ncbi:MAG: hypothetical protein FWG27_02055 [Treponema sp.]|jgi:hypothetical protein|nr:hypothetical protein [Treponema sp.]